MYKGGVLTRDAGKNRWLEMTCGCCACVMQCILVHSFLAGAHSVLVRRAGDDSLKSSLNVNSRGETGRCYRRRSRFSGRCWGLARGREGEKLEKAVRSKGGEFCGTGRA